MTLKILSLGAGVNSTAMLVLAATNQIHVDEVIFADTYGESKATYDYIDNVLTPFCRKNKLPFRTVARDDGCCKLCGEAILCEVSDRWDPKRIYETRNFVCDHIIPLCYGGKDWYEDPEGTNFQTLCMSCNKEKTRNDMSGPKWIHYNSKLTKFLELEDVQ